MRLHFTESIAAPIDAVWARVADVERLEAYGRARDPGLARTPPGPVGPGTTWAMRLPVQGKTRAVTLELVRMAPPDRVALRAGIEGVALSMDIALTALAPDRTGLDMIVEAGASGFAGRLVLGALTLAQSQIERNVPGPDRDDGAPDRGGSGDCARRAPDVIRGPTGLRGPVPLRGPVFPRPSGPRTGARGARDPIRPRSGGYRVRR